MVESKYIGRPTGVALGTEHIDRVFGAIDQGQGGSFRCVQSDTSRRRPVRPTQVHDKTVIDEYPGVIATGNGRNGRSVGPVRKRVVQLVVEREVMAGGAAAVATLLRVGSSVPTETVERIELAARVLVDAGADLRQRNCGGLAQQIAVNALFVRVGSTGAGAASVVEPPAEVDRARQRRWVAVTSPDGLAVRAELTLDQARDHAAADALEVRVTRAGNRSAGIEKVTVGHGDDQLRRHGARRWIRARPARFDLAAGTATVAARRVAVVALLARLDNAITADRRIGLAGTGTGRTIIAYTVRIESTDFANGTYSAGSAAAIDVGFAEILDAILA